MCVGLVVVFLGYFHLLHSHSCLKPFSNRYKLFMIQLDWFFFNTLYFMSSGDKLSEPFLSIQYITTSMYIYLIDAAIYRDGRFGRSSSVHSHLYYISCSSSQTSLDECYMPASQCSYICSSSYNHYGIRCFGKNIS